MANYSLDEINVLLRETPRDEYKIDYKNVLNKEQYEAVCIKNGPGLIIAGAGTGKTRVLTYRVSYLIENKVPPSSILLLSFTKKAANEMEERVKDLLKDDTLGNITTGTYHSFAALILRKFGNKIGIDNNYTIADSEDVKDILDLVKERLYYNEKGILFPKTKELVSIFSMHINKELSLDFIIENYYEKYITVIGDIETQRPILKAFNAKYERACRNLIKLDTTVKSLEKELEDIKKEKEVNEKTLKTKNKELSKENRELKVKIAELNRIERFLNGLSMYEYLTSNIIS